jgi:hypothetical protein
MICLIEPFFGGSHKQLIDLLVSELTCMNIKFDLYTLPSNKQLHFFIMYKYINFNKMKIIKKRY